MIQVSMGQQDLIEPLETHPSTKDLPLSPLSAIDKKSEFLMLDK
jgi:hypothetical protein